MLWATFASADVPQEVVEEWVKSLKSGTMVRVPGRFDSVMLEGNYAPPTDYDFEPDPPQPALPALSYSDEPVQVLRWGKKTFRVEDMARKWGFPRDTMTWFPDTIDVYRVQVGRRTYTCLESNYRGLGMSGHMVMDRAVVVLEPGKRSESLYFSGQYAGCYLVGDYTGDGRLGYVQFRRFFNTDHDYARIMTVERPGKARALRAYDLRATGEGPACLVAEPLPLDKFDAPLQEITEH
ncbi:hypothetical protein EZJ19_08175 [Parasulfuritortus cantonensis]|uniref:Uncharacterized protein n=1 Tax=Parasulfuritortus cantonensis TaxID=2528202 RepID=A0A4R1BD86_9PROT|nr:hypothetical protein [Parasulfuritortus cantonensis]TCJ15030.1 hypothetical protein EZJ19_08175 [Parasulfuritortus cantonensis]